MQVPSAPATLIAAAILFAVIAVATRSPLRALVVVIAWASLFELTYQAIGIAGFGWALGNFPWELIALSGWLTLAAWIGVWPDWRIAIVFAAIMAAWIATGYHNNVPAQTSPIDIRDEVLNEGGKAALAFAYLVGAVRPAFKPLGGRPSIR